MNFGDEMDSWWGMDEDSYLDEDGKPISKEDYYKQFKGGMINPFDKDGNLLPQFQRDPMVDDSMFQKQPDTFDWIENERRTTNPFYHLQGGDLDVDWDEVFGGPEYQEAKRKREEACKICRGEKSPEDVAIEYLRGGDLDVDWDEVFGGPEYHEAKRKREEACKICRGEKSPDDVAIEYLRDLRGGAPNPFYHLRGGADGDDELARRMAEFLAPHISQGIGQVADGIQDFFKSPEQREQEKRDKAELEEAERKKKERESGSWSSYLTPFFGNEGGAKPILPPQDALESKKENPMVEEVIEEPMDDGDIRAYFPNAKIIRYSSLAKLGNIEQLLPRDKSYAFLLYEDSPGSGHWIVLLRYGTTIEFFCSYGSKIDGPLRWYNPKDNAMLGQSKPYLSLLLKKAGKRFKAIHNAVPFQSKKQGVATCGAWDVMRVNQLVNHNQDLHEFQDYMEQVKKETGLTYDEIVVNYVSKR